MTYSPFQNVLVAFSFIPPFNSLLSARDLLNAAIILRQTSSNSILRNNGWKTYWQDVPRILWERKLKEKPAKKDLELAFSFLAGN